MDEFYCSECKCFKGYNVDNDDVENDYIVVHCKKCFERYYKCRHCTTYCKQKTKRGLEKHRITKHSNICKKKRKQEEAEDRANKRHREIVESESANSSDDHDEGFDNSNCNGNDDIFMSKDDNYDEMVVGMEDQVLAASTNNECVELLHKLVAAKHYKEDVPMEDLVQAIMSQEHFQEQQGGQQDQCAMDLDDNSLVSNNNEVNENNTAYGYDQFEIFDKRNDNEKRNRCGRVIQDQAQRYMYSNYTQKLKGNFGVGGFQNVVARAGNRNAELDKMADLEEARIMYSLVKLVLEMSRKDKKELMVFTSLTKAFVELRQGTYPTFVPTTFNDLRSWVLEGPYSIMSMIPTGRKPKRFHNHACYDLKEILTIQAGHGADFGFALNGDTQERNTRGLNGTKAMDSLIDKVKKHMKKNKVDETEIKKTSIGWLLFWSDSFLRCFIKQKENSVWMLTVTVCPPEGKKRSKLYTYILAIGNSSDDHREVIDYYMSQLNDVMKGFNCFFKKSNTFKRVAYGMIAYNADRPENFSVTNVLQEGAFGRVLGYSVSPNVKTFACCEDCYKRLVSSFIQGDSTDNQEGSHKCDKCANFTIVPDNASEYDEKESKLISNRVDKNYPPSYPEEGYGHMPKDRECGRQYHPPVKLSNAFLLTAFKAAYYGVAVGNWSRLNFDSFVSSCNLRGKTADQLYETATKDKKENNIKDSLRDIEPRIWRMIDLFRGHITPIIPMHCLFHGITPDLMEANHEILKSYKKMSEFITFANPILEKVASFRLNWCKTKHLPKAAWVAENSMAYGRLMSYLYGMYLKTKPLGRSSNFPDGPPKARETSEHLSRLLNAYQLCISVLMSKKKINKAYISKCIRLFMCAAHYTELQHGSLVSAEVPFLRKLPVDTLKALAAKLRVKDAQSMNKGALVKKLSSVKDDVLNQFLRPLNQDDSRLQKFQLIYRDMVRDSEVSEGELDSDNFLNEEIKKNTEERNIIKSLAEALGITVAKGARTKTIINNIKNVGDDDVTKSLNSQEVGNLRLSRTAKLNIIIKRIISKKEQDDKERDESKKCIWSGGNWVTLIVNMPDQIEFLGPLGLIW